MAGLGENLSPKDILPEKFKSSLPRLRRLKEISKIKENAGINSPDIPPAK